MYACEMKLPDTDNKQGATVIGGSEANSEWPPRYTALPVSVDESVGVDVSLLLKSQARILLYGCV